MSNLFDPAEIISLDIQNSDLKFPVNRIFCIGRNYSDHAKELGFTVDKNSMSAFYFMKSSCHLIKSGAKFKYPPQTNNLHHEIEMVLAIKVPENHDGSNINPDEYQNFVYGYACGLDMTKRDLQANLRDKGLSWDLAKNFENSAIVGSIMPKERCGLIEEGKIQLKVNNEIRQDADLKQMIWSPAEIISDLSKTYHLKSGDIIFTGTPAGVNSVNTGDYLRGEIEKIGSVELIIE